MADRIEKQIDLKASVSRVWRALTDYREFGEWFRVALEGPFILGEESRGHITWPGYEHIEWRAMVTVMEPEYAFSYTWHPFAVEPQETYADEPHTLVEFRLEPTAEGTLLTVTESGFDKLSEVRRCEAFRMNEGGWEQQMGNIQKHVEVAV